ncbi:SAM-dependent methyltransferase [Catenulispora sp. MAP5-51]|uniref:class I SAM-dependent methyltransferase n=1 Tax=Catenulispora sp. MAP5-51 TaxID=3156298 RepID=UPI003511937B
MTDWSDWSDRSVSSAWSASSYLDAVRESFDTVAADYARLVEPMLESASQVREELAAFADRVRDDGLGPVADLGCGPGHITAFLAGRGVEVFGVDLSPRTIALARSAHPELRFEVGSMTELGDLGVADGSLGGALAWYSTHLMPPELVAASFSEVARALVPGGRLLWGSYVGIDDRVRPEQAYGHPVTYELFMLTIEHLTGLIEAAGLAVRDRSLEQLPGKERWHAKVWAEKRVAVG